MLLSPRMTPVFVEIFQVQTCSVLHNCLPCGIRKGLVEGFVNAEATVFFSYLRVHSCIYSIPSVRVFAWIALALPKYVMSENEKRLSIFFLEN